MRCLVLILFTTAALSALALAQEPGDDPEANLRLLKELRGTERYARFERQFERFRRFSPEQQQKLRDLDQQLHREPAEVQDRHLHILGEYAAWLTRLSDEDRQRVVGAADAGERLKVVREIRERQWVEAQPAARRTEWQKASEGERKRLVERWRAEERARHEEWAEARQWDARRWEQGVNAQPIMRPLVQDPKVFDELRKFVENQLKPMLSPMELARLRPPGAGEQKRNPVAWLIAVVELSDKHPVLASKPQYLRRAELPEEYRKALDKLLENPPRPAVRNQIRNLPEGRWPEYPIAVTKLIRTWNIPMKQQLGPSTAAEVGFEVQGFLIGLSAEDKQKLKRAEGKWPEFPQMLHEIARERKLSLPLLGLPGDPAMWDKIRALEKPRSPQRPK